ncbi:MAG: hypothetical protein M1840_001266 [Geoglossum simile]|nr:MAG: hypothetical protein M1840_001266 [Geoglossum simile]
MQPDFDALQAGLGQFSIEIAKFRNIPMIAEPNAIIVALDELRIGVGQLQLQLHDDVVEIRNDIAQLRGGADKVDKASQAETFISHIEASFFSPDQVKIIKNWPLLGQLVGSQAPTEIAYEDEGTTAFSWGYDIPPQTQKIMWFKLSLEADDHPNIKLPSDLTVVDVVRDYLSALYQHAMDSLYRKFERETEDAAWLAGIGNEHGLELLLEPEATVLYTLKHSDCSSSMIRVNDHIVVCDTFRQWA